MPGSDLSALVQILRDERGCLCNGAFADLGAIANRKLLVMARLDPQVQRLTDLRGALSMAQENERLILAALNGVQAARARMKSILSAETGMSAYDCNGRSLRLSAAASQVERRA